MDIAIVAVGYNRPQSLRRLIRSLCEADYASYSNVPLIISIDFSGDESCLEVAKKFEWKFGKKEVIYHRERLGLKKHILSCGDLTERFDGVIILEDDLVVSPFFYSYAVQAADFYFSSEIIAGVSLYNYQFNDCAHTAFEAIDDGFDNYFMNFPSSSGQLWTKKHWQEFRLFMEEENPFNESDFAELPAFVQSWPSSSSWKKFFYLYLVKRNKYFVFPRISLTTNFGDIGEHYDQKTTILQAPLLLRYRVFNFSRFVDSLSIYDHFFELEGYCISSLVDKGIAKQTEIDLNGAKPLFLIKKKYLISIKKSNNPIQIFSTDFFPAELNLFYSFLPEEDSSCYTLGLTESFVEGEERETAIAWEKKRISILVKAAIKKEVYEMKEYRLGRSIVRPLQSLRNILIGSWFK